MKKLILAACFVFFTATSCYADPYTCSDLDTAISTNDQIALNGVANEVDYDLQQNWPNIYQNSGEVSIIARVVGSVCAKSVQQGNGNITIPFITDLAAKDLSGNQ